MGVGPGGVAEMVGEVGLSVLVGELRPAGGELGFEGVLRDPEEGIVGREGHAEVGSHVEGLTGDLGRGVEVLEDFIILGDGGGGDGALTVEGGGGGGARAGDGGRGGRHGG